MTSELQSCYKNCRLVSPELYGENFLNQFVLENPPHGTQRYPAYWLTFQTPIPFDSLQ